MYVEQGTWNDIDMHMVFGAVFDLKYSSFIPDLKLECIESTKHGTYEADTLCHTDIRQYV